MGKHEKLLKRLCSQPNDDTYLELKKPLSSFGFEEDNKGKSPDARVAYLPLRKTIDLTTA